MHKKQYTGYELDIEDMAFVLKHRTTASMSYHAIHMDKPRHLELSKADLRQDVMAADVFNVILDSVSEDDYGLKQLSRSALRQMKSDFVAMMTTRARGEPNCPYIYKDADGKFLLLVKARYVCNICGRVVWNVKWHRESVNCVRARIRTMCKEEDLIDIRDKEIFNIVAASGLAAKAVSKDVAYLVPRSVRSIIKLYDSQRPAGITREEFLSHALSSVKTT